MASHSDPDYQRLLALLQQSEARAAQSEARATQSEARAAQSEARAAQSEERAAQSDQRMNPTTFREFIKLGHECLAQIKVQENNAWTTKGSVTSVKDRCCPTHLREWEEFPKLQEQAFNNAYSLFHPTSSTDPPLQFLDSAHFIQGLGRALCRKKLGSELDLVKYIGLGVENHVENIMKQLADLPEAREIFNLPSDIDFENHANSLSDFADEVQDRLELRVATELPRTPKKPSNRPLYADQICVYQDVHGDRRLLLIVEYKPPHKLTSANLRAGLRNMHLPNEVLNLVKVPAPGTEEKLVYNAEKLATTVVTQLFSEMIENGIEYGYITTGLAYVFLQIREDEPTTVYYHLSEPNIETDTKVDGDPQTVDFNYPFTAISQVLSFCLMATSSRQRSQRWRAEATSKLQKYQIDYDYALHQIPPEERNQTPMSAAYKGRNRPIDPRSPYLLRGRNPKQSCLPEDQTGPRSDPSPNGSSDESQGPGYDSPTRHRDTRANAAAGKKPAAASKGTQQSGSHQTREYCTQGCLLGLVRQTALDEECPNVDAHRGRPGGTSHPITKSKFRRMLQAQLCADRDHDCEPLGKQGARGALFRLTLRAWGYTLVGKGTVEVFIPDLKHEGRVYRQLRSLQGRLIPVHLGNIDLSPVYYLDFRVRIQHMLLMSWIGELVGEVAEASNLTLREHTHTFEEEALRCGVIHEDLRYANVLWDRKLRRAMVIDFERVTWIRPDPSAQPASAVLQEISNEGQKKRKPQLQAGRSMKSALGKDPRESQCTSEGVESKVVT